MSQTLCGSIVFVLSFEANTRCHNGVRACLTVFHGILELPIDGLFPDNCCHFQEASRFPQGSGNGTKLGGEKLFLEPRHTKAPRRVPELNGWRFTVPAAWWREPSTASGMPTSVGLEGELGRLGKDSWKGEALESLQMVRSARVRECQDRWWFRKLRVPGFQGSFKVCKMLPWTVWDCVVCSSHY